jgi:competence protein ComEA
MFYIEQIEISPTQISHDSFSTFAKGGSMIAWLEQHKGLVTVGLTLLTLIGGATVYTRQPDPPPLVIITPEPTPTETPLPATATPAPTPTPAPLRVYITGEVNQPDVYVLPAGSIIKDALAAAGGETEEADLTVVNLAKALQDQQQITIPAKAANLPTPGIIEGGEVPTPLPLLNSQRDQQKSVQLPIDGKININTADLALLTTLSGIGPAIGQRIIDYRQTVGPFATIEAIQEVKGIGSATFEKIKAFITVDTQ